jgi:hypothetical protein
MENKKLNLQELEVVAGGTTYENMDDATELYMRGLVKNKYVSPAVVREKLHSLGYTGFIDNNSPVKKNIYTDKQGNVITRDQFWAKFDAENGTKIIRPSNLNDIIYRRGV